jgi:hypothetical protein
MSAPGGRRYDRSMVEVVVLVGIWVVTIVAMIQVISKAGYSPWWILLPVSIAALMVGVLAVLIHDSYRIGFLDEFNLDQYVEQVVWLTRLLYLDILVNFVMFLVFAFADWPVLRAARGHIPVIVPGHGRRSYPAPGTPGAEPATGSHAPGWYKSGAVGAGEQSYWDGSAWTARRQWKDHEWVDVPLPAQAPPA